MDSLNTIPNSGSFGDISSKLNDNFSKVGQSLTALENVAIANKGYFDTLASLQAAFPSPKAGNIAYVANVASSTGYYIYNVVAGVWTATTTEAPAVDVAISNYAQHGYSSSPKTLKQVDDEVVQTGVENILAERTNLRLHNKWTLRGYAKPGTAAPSGAAFDAYIPTSTGNIWGLDVTNRSEQIIIWNELTNQFQLHWLVNTGNLRLMIDSTDGYIYITDIGRLVWSHLFVFDCNTGKKVYLTDGTNTYSDRNEVLLQEGSGVFIVPDDFGAANNGGSISLYITTWNRDAQRRQRYSIGTLLSLLDERYQFGDIFDLIQNSNKNQRAKIKLELEKGAIVLGGGFGSIFQGKSYYRTSRYIDVSKNTLISLTVPIDLEVRYITYNRYFGRVRGVDFYSLQSGNNHIVLTKGDIYIRFCFRKSASLEDLPEMNIVLSGSFSEDFERFNIRSSDGYERLIIPVNVASATASDNTSNNIQDSENILHDLGLLTLPETYTNDGEPTRLIIYCHGAGVNYTSSMTTFPTTDIRPEYWLSEGYAVMDIEGNPFNDIDEHFYIPQAIQSYIAAYEWVIKNYNIKRDGVFLGGRSMGGGMVFEILQSRIPVIAACPLVPVANTLLAWNYCNAQRRAFLADKLGFTGTAPTWTNSNPMTAQEWQYLKDNFEKMVKYSPLWRGITNLPTKDELFEHAHIASSVQYDANEASVFENLQFKVKAPVKIFSVKDDTTIPYRRNAELMYKMILNAAQVCELRLFETGGHHFEIDNPNCLTTITNSFGQVMSNIPVVYIEMLQFWRRYE